jgi:ribosomal protein S8
MVKLRYPLFSFGSFLSTFKNALLKKKVNFFVHYSKLNALICEYFFKNHFFSEVFYLYTNKNDCCFILVTMESFEGELILKNINILYKPSRPLYMNAKKLKRMLNRQKAVFLLSTSEGILNSVEALQIGVGGIILFEYY